jgi:2-amino-4-hydroxy-6-hydroxymethyldihydropteridine diphosphokinase
LLQIELEMGRRRYEKWHERLLDIDILYHHDVVCQTDRLTLPHPEIQNRRFALMPLCDLAAGEVHPVLKKTQQQLLNECPDTLWAEKLG